MYTQPYVRRMSFLSVNDNHINTIEINRDLPAGNIGIGFSSPLNVAVDVEIESLKVSEP